MKAILISGWLFASLVCPLSLSGKEPEDDRSGLVVPLDNPAVARAQSQLAVQLAGVKPRRTNPPRNFELREGRSVTYGDLFKTGGCFALVEMAPPDDQSVRGFALAEWIAPRWKIRGLWTIPTTWRPEEWKSSGDDYFPVRPATTPFQLRDLDGDGIPELVVAGGVEKYYQEFYLLRFRPKTHGLALLQSSAGRPKLIGRYVRLHHNSGRRAIWAEWQFFQWAGARLIPTASWHDEAPYNNVDPAFVDARVYGRRGGGKFIITESENDAENESSYVVTKNEQPWAKVTIAWKKSLVGDLEANAVEKAWLFEKITGLPRRFYPDEGFDPLKSVRLEDGAKVRVTGAKAAVRTLRTKPRQ